MPFDVSTKDCAQLNDSELAEMADLCAETPSRYEIGDLSKQAEAWVLVTQVREGAHLRGFSFSTLERIGGTPAIILGLAHVRRTSKRDQVLKGIMNDNYRRALMAFPDEDVLVGTRLFDPSGFEAFKNLDDVVPRPDYRPSGEDRAWGRRLAKRFGIDTDSYDDRTFLAVGDGTFPCVLDHASLKPEAIPADVAAFFGDHQADRGDSLVAFGWAMAEDLAKLA